MPDLPPPSARPILGQLDTIENAKEDGELQILRERITSLADPDTRAEGSPMTPRELARYAHDVVTASGVQASETLTIALVAEADVELAIEVATNAYLRGASLVRVISDERLDKNRLTDRLRDKTGAKAVVIASADDALVWNQLVEEEDSAYLMINEWLDDPEGLIGQRSDDNTLRWCSVYWPSPALERVWGLDGPDGERKMAECLLDFSRNGPDDPLGSYAQHIATLKQRADILNDFSLDTLKITTEEGTDLRVGLLQASSFQVCDWETAQGKRFGCNFPTEEVFFTPDPKRTEGRLVSVVPIAIGPYEVESLQGEFQRGELQREGLIVTSSGQEDPALADDVYSYLKANPGALRLGEVALIGLDSRIGAKGELYGIYNIDENGGPHVAIGESFLAGLKGMDEQYLDASQRNRCLGADGYTLHYDFTLSQGQVDVRGITRDGRELELIKGGTWNLEATQAEASINL